MLCGLSEWMNIDYQLNYELLLQYKTNKVNKHASIKTHGDPKNEERVS